MNIIEENSNILIRNAVDFDIEQTLECGQCFHFNRIGEKEYAVAARGRLLHISQEEKDITFHNTTRECFETVWRPYFDLDRDYTAIKDWLIQNEREMLGRSGMLETAILEKGGIRIINQEFFETLISFIISQNKQIPHIKQIISLISAKYGSFLGTIDGVDYYSFPDAKQLAGVSEYELRLCKTGFRAPYIVDACQKVLDQTVDEKRMRKGSSEEAMEELMKIHGIGTKVASCVSLFALGKRDSFPVDVWVKRIMEEIYFKKDTTKEIITAFAAAMYGEYGGYAQQYLFCYGREVELGVKGRI